MDTNKIFDTSFNYQKVALKGSSTDAVPTSGATVTITHNLGKIGSVRVWYEPGNSRRFPVSFEQYSDSGVSPANLVTGQYYLTTNSLIITYVNNSGSTKTVVTRYRIYYDT